VSAAALELRTRGHNNQTIKGGFVISGAGIVTFAVAVRSLSR
jgi:hypothetical protein